MKRRQRKRQKRKKKGKYMNKRNKKKKELEKLKDINCQKKARTTKPRTTEASQKTNASNCIDDLEEQNVNLNLSGDESGSDADSPICGKTYKG